MVGASTPLSERHHEPLCRTKVRPTNPSDINRVGENFCFPVGRTLVRQMGTVVICE
jgi:hypothetical protein